MQIIDNFLDQDYFNELKELMIVSRTFPWYYNNGVVRDNEYDNYQFTHVFYANAEPLSSFYKNIKPCAVKLNAISLIRIKANLIPQRDKIIEHGFHIDVAEAGDNSLPGNLKHVKNIKTAILYMNTNNGYTLFEDGTKVNSIENRMVVFDCATKHTGTTCTDEKLRVVVNFNFF
jgi:hypothetical protein